MDVLLGKVTQHAVNYAIRSGITITASFAIRQSARLLKSAPASDSRNEVNDLQKKLQRKIEIISPAIDMIELISARGNSSLISAVTLIRDLRYQIQNLGVRLEKASADSEQFKTNGGKWTMAQVKEFDIELQSISAVIRQLLQRIEDAVPLINLAITTSGAKLSSHLPSTVSPSRLLQASTFLNTGDTKYRQMPQCAVQIGPTFNLTVYMLFAGHNRPQTEEEMRDTTWKEVIHKARVKLRRVPLDILLSTGQGSSATPQSQLIASGKDSSARKDFRIPADARADEFGYQLMIIEDFEDDRVHDFEHDNNQPGPFDDVAVAGIRETISIHEISKIFYADTGKVLNISVESEEHHPVLLLKRDLNAVPPRRMVNEDDLQFPPVGQDGDDQQRQDRTNHFTAKSDDPWRFPPSLDPEWVALEVYAEESDNSESEVGYIEDESDLSQAVTNLNIRSPVLKLAQHNSIQPSSSSSTVSTVPSAPWLNSLQTSLSLLEMLLRLTSLQQFQQASHLTVPDELLNFFLEESATTGAGGDEAHRQAVRADARRRVGWDPYDESPLKRRGEDYQYQQGYTPSQEGRYSSQYSREGTPVRPQADNIWSPASGRGEAAQTRSMTGFSSDSNYSPSPANKSRPNQIRRQDAGGEIKQGSPLRRDNSRDEGLGTSPVSTRHGR